MESDRLNQPDKNLIIPAVKKLNPILNESRDMIQLFVRLWAFLWIILSILNAFPHPEKDSINRVNHTRNE
tara:strand:+ start:1396 stop:1605 length:210 start_codon:yes stop_codon:yes gene_type:complete